MIKNIIIEGTSFTPTVHLKANEGLIELIGRSIPENPFEFYKPVNEWLEKYGSIPKSTTIVNIKLEYFNTASSKYLLTFFKHLEAINQEGNTIKINWFCEENDDDMKEAGEDYNAIIKIPFNIIKVKNLI